MASISYSDPAASEQNENYNELNEEERRLLEEDMRSGASHDNTNGSNDDNNQDNNNNNNGEDDDITPELLEEFELELDLIPEREKLDYTNALISAPPDIFEVDSSPVRFLRAENYNPERAARRLVRYWEMRCDVFLDDAYKSMTSVRNDGAVSAIKNELMLIQDYIKILPDDSKGRTVICLDRTNVRFNDYSDQSIFPKFLWFAIHIALLRKPVSTTKNGVILINIARRYDFDFAKRVEKKKFVKSVSDCFPFKVRCIHLCSSSSSYINLAVPVIKLFLSKEDKQRIQVHNNLSTSAIAKSMEKFGLLPTMIPKSIGGLCTDKSPWYYENEREGDAMVSTTAERHHVGRRRSSAGGSHRRRPY